MYISPTEWQEMLPGARDAAGDHVGARTDWRGLVEAWRGGGGSAAPTPLASREER